MSAVAGARFVVEADGAARGNPGPAGYGAVVKDAEGRVLAETAEAIGVATNNVAEYRGLIAGLRALLGLGAEGEPVEVRMDSRLVIEQMSGRWKVKHEGLRPLAAEAAGLARRFRVTWTWVPREQNGHADRLANEAVDAAERDERWAPSGGPRAEAAAPGAPPGPEAPQAPRAPAGPEPPSAAGVPTGPEAPPAPGAPPASEAPPAPGATAEPRDTGAAPAWETGPRAAAGDRAPRPVRTATSLLLIRHGETPFSVEKRFSGVGDPALTPNGVAQAEALARRLAGEQVDAIVSSPLKRARQTAEAIAARTGLTVEVEEDLRETDFGAWEGLTFAEVRQGWPDLLTAWLRDPEAAPPGGESFAATARRVERARRRIIEAHPGRRVAVVSHVTPIKLLVSAALNAPFDAIHRMHLDLACLSVIDHYADGPAVVRLLNDTGHLR
ncbi:bifunctional RNase H/acid phosphatase [Thermobispora bispora]|uniref:bifunctional RNase H/acid phosphatase n=1 Tax=Thermobispora bispora TaxID=2006 RepID=UPI00197CFC6E|nr:bifunctional RNase H/acid phosphatase [Thermobispora bispora]QSI48749.1 bifunctional RNase H/acid phosphatase [Thermobispora bispora]